MFKVKKRCFCWEMGVKVRRVRGVGGRWTLLLNTGKEAAVLLPWPLVAWPHVGEARTAVLLLSLERGNGSFLRHPRAAAPGPVGEGFACL